MVLQRDDYGYERQISARVSDGRGRRFLLTTIQASTVIRSRLPLLRQMQDYGWQVHVAIPPSPEAVHLATWGIGVHEIPLRRGSANPFLELRAWMALRRLVRQIRPDLCHHISSKAVIYGGLSGARLNVATVTGIGFSLDGGSGLRALPVKVAAPRMYRAALGRCGKVIFQNESDRELFVVRGLVDVGKTMIIRGSGVDVRHLNPGLRAPNAGRTRFVLLARMLRSKGVCEFVEAARIVRRRTRHPVEFVLAGPTDCENPSALRSDEIYAWEREGVVRWLGEVRGPEEAYRDADVAVLPSHREGVPRSILEASAMGLPVITTDAPGCADAVIHGETGIKVPVQNADLLADAIEWMLLRPDLRRKMGAGGREFVSEQFCMRKVIDETVSVYDELLASQSGLTTPDW